MIPKLGQIVFYVPLVDEPAQSFVAAAGGPVGEAVIQPMPKGAGFRAATVVGLGLGNAASLVVYKQHGDPFRSPDGGDDVVQRIGNVPYSGKFAVPGTYMTQEDADKLGTVKTAPTATDLLAMSKDTLFAHAADHEIDLSGVTTKTAALPLVAAHHNVTLPVS